MSLQLDGKISNGRALAVFTFVCMCNRICMHNEPANLFIRAAAHCIIIRAGHYAHAGVGINNLHRRSVVFSHYAVIVF